MLEQEGMVVMETTVMKQPRDPTRRAVIGHLEVHHPRIAKVVMVIMMVNLPNIGP